MKEVWVNFRLFLTLFIISLLTLFFDYLNFLNPVKSLFATISIPIQYGIFESSKNVAKQFEFVWTARLASQENKALKSQLSQLITYNAQLEKELRELKSVIDQKGLLGENAYDLIPARVIGQNRFLLIDKGSANNVKEGDIVVFKNNFVGQIKVASPKTSQVLLSSDPDSKITVFTLSSTGKAKGILSGQFGSETVMEKIIRQENVAIGDIVYSEGTEGKLPKGLIMGKISKISDQQNEVFKSAEIKPLFEISDLEVVYIIRI